MASNNGKSSALLNVEGLVKSYRGRRVVDGVHCVPTRDAGRERLQRPQR